MRRRLVTSPRRRLVAIVGWLLLTLIAATAAGYAVWQMTGTGLHLEEPRRASSTGTEHVAATATVIPPTPRVIRLTPDPSLAMTARPTTAIPSLASESEPNKRSITPEPRAASEPTPSATRVAPELVANGNFEAGPSAWYLEDGAAAVASTTAVDGMMVLQIPSAGGYADQRVAASPGETFLLTGSGRVTAQGDTGMLGVVYRDGTGARLTALEPPPLLFTRTQFRAKSLAFTVPAGVVVVLVYAYKEPGPGLFEADAVSVRHVLEP
jgi:hypothetical protein